MKNSSKILITGAGGLIGSHLVEILKDNGYNNIFTPSSRELDLREQSLVRKYFEEHKPEYVFHLAAIVGGIVANSTLPGKFAYENTIMSANILEESRKHDVKKLLVPGSSCTYPKNAVQPISEESFMEGMPEITNMAYASAKISGIIMAQSYIKQYGMDIVIPMPTNAYGENDHFDLQNSHVIPAMIMKFADAVKNNADSVTIWGTGSPKREFMHSYDSARAFLFLMENYDSRTGLLTENYNIDLIKNNLDDSGPQGGHCEALAEAIQEKLLIPDKYKKNHWIATVAPLLRNDDLLCNPSIVRSEGCLSSTNMYMSTAESRKNNWNQLEMGNAIINVGSGQEISIKELAVLVAKITGFKGEILHDLSKPDGIMRKALDSSRLFNMGFRPVIGIEEGIRRVYEAKFCEV